MRVQSTYNRYPTVLTIAGSDSGGCAGIQADIKSISANGAYAASVITAITSQNTIGVNQIFPVPVPHIISQIEAVLEDIDIDVIKIGMLHSSEVIDAVSNTLEKYDKKNIIIDPVMVATSGDRLLNQEALQRLFLFLPNARLITPNIPEGEILLEKEIHQKNLPEFAKAIGQRFKTSVLLKGGHGKAEDSKIKDVLYLFDTDEIVTISNPYIQTKNTHGTGCSLSSAIAANISLGNDLKTSVVDATTYINKAITSGKDKLLGKGNGPVDHFFSM